MALENLRTLRENMISNEFAVTVVSFDYKNENYYVAICLLTDDDKKKKVAKFALVRLCFMRENNLNDYLDCYANSTRIIAGLTELRNFLGVEYQKDGIGWINGFYDYLGGFIPLQIPYPNNRETQAILHTICIHEERDPYRTYRKHMFRNGKINGKQKHRTEYNGQLASFKFPTLYPRFKDDKAVSFAFTDDPNAENTEVYVLKKFEENERKR